MIRFRRVLGRRSVAGCRAARVIWLRATWALLVPALVAESTPWGVQNVRQTGLNLSELSVLSTNGDIYSANSAQGPITLSRSG